MNRSERAVVVRPSLTVDTRSLHESTFVFMQVLNDGAALQHAASVAADVAVDFELSEHLQGLFAIGAVSAINDNSS